MFQSLGRDSVGWDPFSSRELPPAICGFNPSVGILWGGTVLQEWIGRAAPVSIPRSGFCGVGLG